MTNTRWTWRVLRCIRASLILVLFSCGPRVKTTLIERADEPYALEATGTIGILGVADPIPAGAVVLGSVKVGDTGFSTDCGWERVLAEARLAARNAGGNVLKLTVHEPPGFASSCHRITASILRVDRTTLSGPGLSNEAAIDTTWDHAMLYVYRPGGLGALVSYNLHLGDSLICRVTNKSTFAIKIEREMRTTLWARTEARSEVAFDARFGHSYYLRCTVAMGAMVGHPFLELVDPSIGRLEYEAVSSKRRRR